MLNSAVGNAFTFAMAYCVSFSLPFTIACGAPPCMTGITCSLGVGWGKLLKRSPGIRLELLQYLLVLCT